MDERASTKPAPPAPREVELKLEIEPDGVDALRRHPLVPDGAARRTETLRSVYFDTERLALREAGLSLRIRETGGRRVQTLKAARGGFAGLFDRDEWEQEVGGEEPDLAALEATPLKAVLADADDGGLRPAFRLAVERMVVPVGGNGWAAELTLDVGEVRAGKRSAPLHEVELELRQGEPADLFAFARALGETLPVRLGVRTKAERGYALVERRAAKAFKAQAPALVSGMSAGAAFQAIGRACLRHLMANEALLRESRDPDVVHQMRVAMRRLRAAITLFRDVVRCERRDAVRAELRWISSELGAARDLDVFIARTLAPVRAKHDDEALRRLAEAYERRREAAYGRALEAVGSRRFRTLVIDVAAWIETGGWLTAARTEEGRRAPVEAYAARALKRRRRKVKRRGAELERLDAHARHALRIEVKKLRYAAEFFAPLFDDGRGLERRKPFLLALEALQDHLGDLNDVAVGRTLLRQDGGEERATALVEQHQDARDRDLAAPMLHAYRAFRKAKPFWT